MDEQDRPAGGNYDRLQKLRDMNRRKASKIPSASKSSTVTKAGKLPPRRCLPPPTVRGSRNTAARREAQPGAAQRDAEGQEASGATPGSLPRQPDAAASAAEATRSATTHAAQDSSGQGGGAAAEEGPRLGAEEAPRAAASEREGGPSKRYAMSAKPPWSKHAKAHPPASPPSPSATTALSRPHRSQQRRTGQIAAMISRFRTAPPVPRQDRAALSAPAPPTDTAEGAVCPISNAEAAAEAGGNGSSDAQGSFWWNPASSSSPSSPPPSAPKEDDSDLDAINRRAEEVIRMAKERLLKPQAPGPSAPPSPDALLSATGAGTSDGPLISWRDEVPNGLSAAPVYSGPQAPCGSFRSPRSTRLWEEKQEEDILEAWRSSRAKRKGKEVLEDKGPMDLLSATGYSRPEPPWSSSSNSNSSSRIGIGGDSSGAGSSGCDGYIVREGDKAEALGYGSDVKDAEAQSRKGTASTSGVAGASSQEPVQEGGEGGSSAPLAVPVEGSSFRRDLDNPVTHGSEVQEPGEASEAEAEAVAEAGYGDAALEDEAVVVAAEAPAPPAAASAAASAAAVTSTQGFPSAQDDPALEASLSSIDPESSTSALLSVPDCVGLGAGEREGRSGREEEELQEEEEEAAEEAEPLEAGDVRGPKASLQGLRASGRYSPATQPGTPRSESSEMPFDSVPLDVSVSTSASELRSVLRGAGLSREEEEEEEEEGEGGASFLPSPSPLRESSFSSSRDHEAGHVEDGGSKSNGDTPSCLSPSEAADIEPGVHEGSRVEGSGENAEETGDGAALEATAAPAGAEGGEAGAGQGQHGDGVGSAAEMQDDVEDADAMEPIRDDWSPVGGGGGSSQWRRRRSRGGDKGSVDSSNLSAMFPELKGMLGDTVEHLFAETCGPDEEDSGSSRMPEPSASMRGSVTIEELGRGSGALEEREREAAASAAESREEEEEDTRPCVASEAESAHAAPKEEESADLTGLSSILGSAGPASVLGNGERSTEETSWAEQGREGDQATESSSVNLTGLSDILLGSTEATSSADLRHTEEASRGTPEAFGASSMSVGPETDEAGQSGHRGHEGAEELESVSLSGISDILSGREGPGMVEAEPERRAIPVEEAKPEALREEESLESQEAVQRNPQRQHPLPSETATDEESREPESAQAGTEAATDFPALPEPFAADRIPVAASTDGSPVCSGVVESASPPREAQSGAVREERCFPSGTSERSPRGRGSGGDAVGPSEEAAAVPDEVAATAPALQQDHRLVDGSGHHDYHAALGFGSRGEETGHGEKHVGEFPGESGSSQADDGDAGPGCQGSQTQSTRDGGGEAEDAGLGSAEDDFIEFLRVSKKNRHQEPAASRDIGPSKAHQGSVGPLSTRNTNRQPTVAAAATKDSLKRPQHAAEITAPEGGGTGELPPELLKLLAEDSSSRGELEDDEVVAILRRQVERCCRELRELGVNV